MTKTVHIESAAQFSGLLKSSRIVVADFYADWCAPCTAIAPIYEQLSESLSQPKLITFVKVNTDAQTQVASAYQVTALPTFIVFRDGRVLDKVQGADPKKLQAVVSKLAQEVSKLSQEGPGAASDGAASGSGSGEAWLGAALPRGYGNITEEIEIQRCEILNRDPEAGDVRTLFEGRKPSALSGGKGTAKDWVESDADEQLMLFMPFNSMLKLHTLQITSLPPTDDEEAPMRPRTIKLFVNKPHNLGFDEADDTAATQEIELAEDDWKDGTANVALRFVKFQKVNSLVLFVVDGDGEGEKVRLDRVRLIGETGTKREMGKLEKVGEGD